MRPEIQLDETKLCDLYHQGLSYFSIAYKLGVSKSKIHYKIHDLIAQKNLQKDLRRNS